MTIDITKNAGGKSCVVSISWLVIVAMPATACQPAGTMPVCSSVIPKATKAVGGEPSYSKTRGLTSEDFPLVTVCLDKAKKICPGNGCQRFWVGIFSGAARTWEKHGTLPSQHSTYICKQKPPYGERKMSDAFSDCSDGILSRERLKTEMAPSQTQTGRHLQAP